MENKENESYACLRIEGIKFNNQEKNLENEKRNHNNNNKNNITIKGQKHINRQESMGSREYVKVEVNG